MSFNSWLQNLKSTCGLGSGRRALSRPPQRRPRSALPRLLQLETRLTPSLSTLASFIAPAGLGPQGAMVMDGSGNLYGTASAGGASGQGTVFELAHGSGALTTLASFSGTNGATPRACLILDGSGNLYGTTSSGGALHDGTVFKLAPGSGTITTLASFNRPNGPGLGAALTLDGSGNLYGTTRYGGASSDGTVFELAQGSGTITTLASFNGPNGANPMAALILDGSGNLYGTTYIGGASYDGTVFELAHGSGTIATLASFNVTDGANPQAGLILDGSGNLYGTTPSGGASRDGTVFELASGSGTITTLASFNGNDGANPFAGLVMDGSGNLYGTASAGGASGQGTVFELTPGSGALTTLASFNGTNGAAPRAGLILDGSGNLYGTSAAGAGAARYGSVFELAQGGGTITTLASFNETDGAGPEAGLILDGSGNLYGTASAGGDYNAGTVFELAQGSGTLTTLASFNNSDGANPQAGLILDGSGNLYGTTERGGAFGYGTVFELTPGSGTITTLASFNGNDGANPFAGLVMDGSGNLYGTTYGGGASSDGTVFELSNGSGTITTLASFNGTNGERPEAALVMDGSSNLYGTAQLGAVTSDGTDFEVAQGSGTITTLASCGLSYAGLILDGSGNLYGTTSDGGASEVGTVFELARGSGAITTLASFNGTNGASPYAGLVMDRSGNLYGTAYGGGASSDGTVFELARGSGAITAVASFNGTDGAKPEAGLVLDSSGNLYGTTYGGGAGGVGTTAPGIIFEVTNPGTTLALGGFPSPATAGAAGSFTITARNADGTTDTAYTGTVHFTGSDPQAVLPADYTFTAADAGVHTFSATLKTAGTQSLTATDTVTGRIFGSQEGIVVNPAGASQLIIGGVPGVTHGVAFSLTLTLVDAYGNIATGYTGTLSFRSSDSTASLPANYTFTAADAGQHTFKMILRKKGKQTLTITDPLNSALTDSVSISVM